jgi:hypothetical protein
MTGNPAGPHGRHGRSPYRLIRNVALAAGCGLAAVALPALADPAPAGSTPVAARIPSAPPDVVLARSAMAALDADPRLRDVTLIVSVVDRVAVIGGPIPTSDHGRWAEERVRGVSGIADVKNRCFVQGRPDPLVRAVADRLAANPRPITPELPPVVPGLKPVPIDVASGPPTNPALAVADPPAGSPSTSLRPAAESGGFLLPPVNTTGTAPVSGVPPPVPGTLTAAPSVPAVDPTRPESVLNAAEYVRRTDPRFAGLTVRLENGTLVIAGRAPRASDAWDLSEALRRVPGIQRVVVANVEAR